MKYIENLSINEIDFGDELYRTSYLRNDTSLRESFSKAGIIQPPVLQTKGVSFRIVCGFRRLEFLRDEGIFKTNAFIREAEENPYSLFQRSLFENLTSRDLNLVEKAKIIDRLLNTFEKSKIEINREYFPFLGLGQNNKWFDWLSSLLVMPQEIQISFMKGDLSLDLIDFFSGIEAGLQLNLLNLFNEFQVNKNKQKEILHLLQDLLKNEACTLDGFLTHSYLSELKQAKMTPSQKADKFFQWVSEWRYPMYSRAEKSFKKWISEQKISPLVDFQHSPFFELKKYDVRFSFRNSEDLERIIEKLNQIRQAGLEDLEKRINGEAE